MSLVSAQFLIFVIILLFLYYTIGRNYQWILLLLASAAFYMSGDWRDVFYIGATIVIQYVCTRLLDRENEAFEAEVREKQLKGWSRKKKNALVETVNPKWEDLYDRYA